MKKHIEEEKRKQIKQWHFKQYHKEQRLDSTTEKRWQRIRIRLKSNNKQVKYEKQISNI